MRHSLIALPALFLTAPLAAQQPGVPAPEAVATAGKPLAGMTVVGAGRLEVSDKDNNPLDELGPGDIVYPSEMLRAAPAPANVKASEGGALIVFADRKTAHELMMSVPPLIEVLSS